AIPLPDNIKIELANYKRYFTLPNLRWVPEENWHITVLFLGDVGEEKILEINKRLENVSKNFQLFNLSLTDVCLGPPGKNPQMVWAVFKRQWEFEQLAKKIREALADLLKVVYSHQEQIIHVTLARFPFWRGGRRQAPEVKEIHPVRCLSSNRVNFEVKDIWLMESELKPAGAKYTKLQDFKLSNY
ncbi:MAG: RNA 2',3'-cyclic phosphodiesterase, partial [Patescibacteria group bacterium]